LSRLFAVMTNNEVGSRMKGRFLCAISFPRAADVLMMIGFALILVSLFVIRDGSADQRDQPQKTGQKFPHRDGQR